MSTKGFDPRKEITNMRDSLNRVFEDAVASAKSTSAGIAVDIYQTDEHLVVVAGPLYKIKPESVDVSVEGEWLTIQGETEAETDVPESAYLKRERRAGQFKRTLRLTHPVDAANTKAQLKNEILKVFLPKVQVS